MALPRVRAGITAVPQTIWWRMSQEAASEPVPVIESMFIDGQWRPAASGSTFPVTDPASGRVLAHVADGSATDAEAAIEAAAHAFPAWPKRTAYERSAVLYDAHRLMLERS